MEQPQPVVKGAVVAALTTLATAILGMLIALGIDIPADTQAAIMTGLASLVALVGAAAPILAALRARDKVTPVSSPKDVYGNDLVAAPPVE